MTVRRLRLAVTKSEPITVLGWGDIDRALNKWYTDLFKSTPTISKSVLVMTGCIHLIDGLNRTADTPLKSIRTYFNQIVGKSVWKLMTPGTRN